MNNNAVLMINANLGRRGAKDAVGLEAKVKASMRAVREGNWLETNDDALFSAGVGGALLDVGADSDDGRRLTASLDAMRKLIAFLNAAQAGLSVDATSVLPPDDAELPLPLLGWWHETKGGGL